METYLELKSTSNCLQVVTGKQDGLPIEYTMDLQRLIGYVF